MRLPLLAPLLVCVLLAGCSIRGQSDPDEGGEVVDRGTYTGGAGYALVVKNLGQDSFDVLVRVLGAGNAELARVERPIAAGGSYEGWFPLEVRSTYSARFSYSWSPEAGSTSAGSNDQVFDAHACPEVNRLEWELRQDGNTVGSAFLGKTCVSADAAPRT